MRLFGQLLVLSLAVTVGVGLADSNDNVDIIEKSSTSVLNRVKRQCKCVNNRPCNCRNNKVNKNCVQSCVTSNQCTGSSSCVNSCCQSQSQNAMTACFGLPASSLASNNMCTGGNFVVNGYCCPCKTGRCIGPCVNKQCPAQYECNVNANACCPSPMTVTSTTTAPPSAGMIMSIGPCIKGQCPVNYVCLSNNLCYPTIAISSSSSLSNLIATTTMTTTTETPLPFIVESTIPCQCPVAMFCDTNRFCSSATEIDGGGGTRMRCQCQEGQVCGRGNMCYMITFPSRGSSNDN